MHQVPSAPSGAARLNRARCARAVRLLRPCLRRTAESPKAAGALCMMMARKMMNSRDTFPVAEEAPSAMPSAMEWITRPIVVEELLELVARGGGEPGGGGGSSGESSAAECECECEWWRKPWSEVASGILLSVIYADVLLPLPFAIVVLLSL